MDTFWIVWKDNGGSPSKQHTTMEEAKAEAKRLSEKHLGETFRVFACVYAYGVQCKVAVSFVEEAR